MCENVLILKQRKRAHVTHKQLKGPALSSQDQNFNLVSVVRAISVFLTSVWTK